MCKYELEKKIRSYACYDKGNQTLESSLEALSSLSSPSGLIPLLGIGPQSPRLCCRALMVQKRGTAKIPLLLLSQY